MAKLITGLFNTRSSAMLAIEDLMRHGVPEDDLSLLNTDTNRGREFFVDVRNKAPKGAVVGTVVGMILGGLVALLMHLGHLRDFGWGMTSITMMASILMGVGTGGIIGLIIGALIGATVPEYEMNLYRADRRHGGILLGVYASVRRKQEVSQLLEAAGGRMITTKTVRDEVLPERSRAFSHINKRDSL